MNNETNFIDEKEKTQKHERIRCGEFISTYLNENGTKTIYISTAPMEQEEVFMRQEGNEYFRKGDFIEVRMPERLGGDSKIKIGQGMYISTEENKVCKAKAEDKCNIFGQKKACIVYEDSLGKQIDLNCYPTSFGINTEIVIPAYTGRNVFQIKAEQRPAENLYVIADSPDYTVLRTDQEVKYIVYTPLAVDAENKWCYRNRIEMAENKSNGTYTVSYVINEAFLKDPGTKYPVTLNQSIYAYVPKQSDTAMYSGTGDTGTHHLSPYMLLGDRTSKGEGWGFVRYEALYDFDIPAEKILSAEYFFHNLFDSGKELKLGVFAIVNDWCSVNTRWRTKPGYDKVPVKTARVKERGVYSIDITRLFVEMMKNKRVYEPPYSLRNSFFLRSLTKESNMLLAAGDSGIFSPYLRIVVAPD